MKNFDEVRKEREQRDRSFTIGGETFVYRAGVAPEMIARWSMMSAGEIDPTEQEALDIFDETVLAFLEPGSEEKWAQVRDPKVQHPLNLDDLQSLVTWLFEMQAGRPTGPSPDSMPGSEEKAADTSKEDSSLPVGVPV